MKEKKTRDYTRSTFAILFYINRSKQKKNGKCPILGRISVDGLNTAFSTGMDISPDSWDAKLGLALGKSKETKFINCQIENYQSQLERYYRDLVNNHAYITAESLKNALLGIGAKNTGLMQEFGDLVEEKRQSIGIKIVSATYDVYPNAYRHLKNFLREKYGVSDIPLGQVDYAFIEAYAYYLKIDLTLSPRTVKGNMIPFKTTIKRAYMKGLIHQDPFFDWIPERIIPKRPWLTMEEIERLMKVHSKKNATWNFTRDMFIFCSFTGITAIDLRNLKNENILVQEDDSQWIVLNRQKTGTTSYIPLLDLPKQIIDRYRGTEFEGTEGRVFTLQTHVNMNYQLKKLAQLAKINKRLTFHMSRFTFATTVCLSQGVPIESLSQMMGHLSIKTTQIYAEVTKNKIDEDMTKLEQRMQNH